MWNGGGDFRPQTGDEKLDKLLKKKARFIIHNDTLYVNSKGLKYQGCVLGNWFSLGFRYENDKICFIGIRTSRKEVTKYAMFGVVGGAVGAAIGTDNAFEQYKNKTCYFIDSDQKKITRMTAKYMESIMSEHPSILEEYNNLEKKEKERADVILRNLQQLQLLDKY